MLAYVKNFHDKLKDAETASPITIEQLSNSTLKVVRLDGDYPFHSHENSDETFIIIEGELFMDRENLPTLNLKSGDVLTIPKGLKHRTRTKIMSKVLLLGPK